MEINEYNEKGYVVVDNFLPLSVADKLETLFTAQKDWKYLDQIRENHYKHAFKTDSIFFPDEDDVYLAKFWISNKLYLDIENIFNEFFKPKLNEISNSEPLEFDTRCYKLESGDFYRTHVDDYAGIIGSTFYLNKKWCWDWGGILHIGEKDDSLTSIFPKYNRLIVHDMKKFRFPHFISPVTDYAKCTRYTIVSFGKEKGFINV